MSGILVISASYYSDISEMLLSGAKSELESSNTDYEVITVPGVLEIPSVLSMGVQPKRYVPSGFVVLGCVIRGETDHYDIVAHQSARAIMDLTTAHQLAIGNGILTVETMEQALERADPTRGNKGRDAATAVIKLLEARKFLDG